MTQAERNEMAYLFGDICPDTNPLYCDRCGEHITEYAYEVDGEWVCDECFREHIEGMSCTEIADAMRLQYKWEG